MDSIPKDRWNLQQRKCAMPTIPSSASALSTFDSIQFKFEEKNCLDKNTFCPRSSSLFTQFNLINLIRFNLIQFLFRKNTFCPSRSSLFAHFRLFGRFFCSENLVGWDRGSQDILNIEENFQTGQGKLSNFSIVEIVETWCFQIFKLFREMALWNFQTFQGNGGNLVLGQNLTIRLWEGPPAWEYYLIVKIWEYFSFFLSNLRF